MKLDLEKIKKANISIEVALGLVYLDYKNRDKIYPGVQPTTNTFLDLVEAGLVKTDSFVAKLTVKGIQLLREVTGQEKLKLRTKTVGNKFYEFWNAFPASDAHGKWRRTRSLKSDRKKSEEKYLEHIKNGVKHEDIMKALKWQIEEAKKNSQTANRMTFIKNSSTWLNQAEFEIILEDMQSTDQNDDNWTETVI